MHKNYTTTKQLPASKGFDREPGDLKSAVAAVLHFAIILGSLISGLAGPLDGGRGDPPLNGEASGAAGSPATPRDDVLRALRAMYARPHRTTYDDGVGRTSVVEYVPPDRYRLSVGSDIRVVEIGAMQFYKGIGSNKWHEHPRVAPIPKAPKILLDQLSEGKLDVQSIGDEVVAGSQARSYRISGTIQHPDSSDQAPINDKVWIDIARDLPLRLQHSQRKIPSSASNTPGPRTEVYGPIEYDLPVLNIDKPEPILTSAAFYADWPTR